MSNLVTTCKRERETLVSPSPKRPRTSTQAENLLSCPYERLQDVHFPLDVMDLPHILKQINEFLMSPEEAMVEASRTGQLDWLDELLVEYDCSVTDSFVAAAGSGQFKIVRVLLFELTDEDDELDSEAWGTLKMAVVAAADNGHVDVVEYLLPEVFQYKSTNKLYQVISTAQGALEGAAANGHLDMVQFMIEHAKTNDYLNSLPGWGGFDALSRAISGGNSDVVDFLVKLDGVHWDLLEAAKTAISVGRNELAESFYDVYPLTTKKRNLFVDLARDGSVVAVKHFYDHGHDDVLLVGDAFVAAADRGQTSVVEFLLNTGWILSTTFDKAFKAAASCLWTTNTFVFLYNKNRASPEAINKAFEISHDIKTTKLLYENESLPNESIIAGFRKAAGCGSKFTSSVFQRVDIMLFLAKHECIPSEDISEALVIAANDVRRIDAVKVLLKDARISSEALGKVFASVARLGLEDMVNSLYDEYVISPEALLEAFKAAISCIPVVRDIVKFLSVSTMPAEFKHQAFVAAARHDRKRVLQILTESMTEDWPLDVLKAALNAAYDKKVKNFIRMIVCAQLF